MAAPFSPSARTILGPLTTTFTPAPSCTVGQRACPTCNYAWEAQSCFSTTSGGTEVYGVEDNTECWPSTSIGLAVPTPPLWGWGFYSQGIICPTGYTSACSATSGRPITWTPEWSLVAGETAVGCCPSQFACTTNQAKVNTCQFVASSTSLEVFTCESGTSAGLTYLQAPVTIGNTATVFTMYAPLIQINWQGTDVAALSTIISTSSNPTPSTTSPSTFTSTGSAVQTTSSGTASGATASGLSTGTKVGIGIGSSLVVIALAMLLFLVLRKPKSKYGLARQDSPATLHELTAEGKPGAEGHNYPASAVSEMASQREAPPVELSDQYKDIRYKGPPPVELDAGRFNGY